MLGNRWLKAWEGFRNSCCILPVDKISYKMHCVLLIAAVVLGSSFILATKGPVILTPEIKYKNKPQCSSWDSLCGLDYRYVTKDELPVQLLRTENDICQCPGNETCAVAYDWDNTTNSIIQRLQTGVSYYLLVKISYCRLPEKPKRPCGFSKPVMVSRGRGLFKFDIVGDILCRCDRPLVQKSSWIEQEYVYVEYGCGQPKCAKRDMTTCSEITLSGDTLRSNYLCRCRRNEVCKGNLPLTNGQTVQHTCQP